jgi:molybdopterin-containing oxidoreductase family membrane subunit
MLTEISFCITCYLTVLAIEYVPVLLRNRKLRQVPSFLVFEHELHRVVPVLAGVGTFLSFFHQGSLGGLYGVLNGRPFAFREGFAIWPTTFFLFILSAIASGPSFLALTTKLAERLSHKPLVRPGVYETLGKTSGVLLSAYVVLKIADTLVWLNSTSRAAGVHPAEFYQYRQFGTWILFAEIGVFGLVPALILLSSRLRRRPAWFTAGAVGACLGIAFNRFAMTIQTLALPTLSFDEFMTYWPSWQEFGVFCLVIAYAVIVYSLSFRYLPLFPDEREYTAPVELDEEVTHVSGR